MGKPGLYVVYPDYQTTGNQVHKGTTITSTEANQTSD